MATTQVQYRQEFVLGFAQRVSLLKDTTTKEMMVKGNQATFLVADHTGTAVTRGVNGLIPYGENSNTQVTATLVEKHAPFSMTGFNIFQSQADQREIMQLNSMAQINRDIDDIILTELANGTLDTGAAATASLTIINKAMAQLQINGVPWDGNIFAVVSPAFIGYLMQLASFASADYVLRRPFVDFPGLNATDVKGSGQGWHDWMGVKWISSSRVSGVGTNAEKCFMYHKSAIGHAANTNEVVCDIGYDGMQARSWALSSIYHSAKILQNTGIVQMLHDGSAYVAT